MDERAFHWLVLGQACFYLGVLLCIYIKPSGLSANDGISYYGHFRATILPFALALLGSAWFSWNTSRHITNPRLRPLSFSLCIFAVLEAVIIAAPVTVNPWVKHVHTASGSALFALQLLLSGWLCRQLHYAGPAILFTVLEFLGGVGSAIWLLPAHGLLIQSQLVFQMGFSGVLLYAAGRFRTTSPPRRLHNAHAKTD